MVSSQNTQQINLFLSISSHFCPVLEIRTPNIIWHLCFNHVIHCPWSQCKHGCLCECAIQNSFSGLQSNFQYLCLFLLSFLLTHFLSLSLLSDIGSRSFLTMFLPLFNSKHPMSFLLPYPVFQKILIAGCLWV